MYSARGRLLLLNHLCQQCGAHCGISDISRTELRVKDYRYFCTMSLDAWPDIGMRRLDGCGSALLVCNR